MRITSLTLFSNDLESQAQFYGQILGFKVEQSEDSLEIQVGGSRLVFKHSQTAWTYHYCFLIPCNQLENSISWLRKRLDILQIEDDRVTQRFENWNADALYFKDGNDNLAEFIVRHDLKNDSQHPFGLESILNVNEIGLPTYDIKAVNHMLEQEVGSSFWKGNMKRFGTHGSQEGLLLLVNPDEKETWFPTDEKIVSSPFEAVVEHHGHTRSLSYAKGILRIN